MESSRRETSLCAPVSTTPVDSAAVTATSSVVNAIARAASPRGRRSGGKRDNGIIGAPTNTPASVRAQS
ncbi:MAG: hypothetical protein BroJett013_34000 [Alphaproteobacteria bacterium]|nr:MAG: hypothetical protein BroJett013_34000 [Alphaproteobacteria bacterium]